MATIVLINDKEGRVLRVERREQGPTFIPFPELRKTIGFIQQVKNLNPVYLFGRPAIDVLGVDAVNNSPHLTPEQKAEYTEIYRTSALTDDFDVEFEDAPAVVAPPEDTGNGKGNRPTYKVFAYFIDP